MWAAEKLDRPETIALTAKLLLMFPDKDFLKVTNSASWWLNEKAKPLDENLLWPLWDKIEAAAALELTEPRDA